MLLALPGLYYVLVIVSVLPIVRTCGTAFVCASDYDDQMTLRFGKSNIDGIMIIDSVQDQYNFQNQLFVHLSDQ